MRKIALLVFGLLLAMASGASAQGVTSLCIRGTTGNCVPVTATNPLPVTLSAGNLSVTVTDCSGTTGVGVASDAFAASTTKRGFVLRNLSTTVALYFSVTGAATVGGVSSGPLYFSTTGSESYSMDVGPNSALSVIAASAVPFFCNYW